MSALIRRCAKWIVDRTLLPLTRYIVRNLDLHDREERVKLVRVENLGPLMQGAAPFRFPRMITRVAEPELEAAADLIRQHLGSVHLAETNNDIRRFCLARLPADGLLLEFGVFRAESTNFFADNIYALGDTRRWHGFDSFEGLSHDGPGWLWEKGRFDLGGNLPAVRGNVDLHKGWIDDTLPAFLAERPDETIAFIHLDVDIYEPAKTVLQACKPRLRKGSIILFDELIGFAGWRFHEYRALTEVFSPNEFEYISFSDQYQGAIRIL